MSGEHPGKPRHGGDVGPGLFGAVSDTRSGALWWLDSLRELFAERDLPDTRPRPEGGPDLGDDALFGQLVDSAPPRKKSAALFTATAVGHIGAVLALVLVPLLLPVEHPPLADLRVLLIYDPPPPPPLPPPKGSQLAKKEATKPTSPEPKPTPEATPTPELVAQLQVPEEVPDEITPEATDVEDDVLGVEEGHEDGVPEGIVGGDAVYGQVGGVIGGVPGGVVGGTGTTPVYDYDSPPRPIKITKPRYPQEAFIKKIEGTVTVEILIDEKGNVRVMRILESIPQLDDAARRTVAEWQFMPAIKDGRRVATVARAPVTFTIF